jgi:alkylhydroperoxidase/carboxymuconolactone decarboxylase family protein YurZ
MPAKPSTKPLDALGRLLSQPDIEALQHAFHANGAGKKFLQDRFKNALPEVYGPSKRYVRAVTSIFYRPLPKDAMTNRTVLSAADRERCLIALLAARGEEFNLGLHIYMALVEGVSPAEIANIILLAGVYTGVDNFSIGLSTLSKTLNLLKQNLTGVPLKTPVSEKPPPSGSAASIYADLKKNLR